MRRIKRVMALGLGAALSVSTLTGCYTTVKDDNYDTTVVATFGDENIYLTEVNYYLKMLQVTYDYYYDYFYSTYYGFTSKEDFYEYTGLTSDGTSTWDAMKEDAMGMVQQTYILCSFADEYDISLSDEDLELVDEAVEEFMTETDSGIIEACKIDEESLTEIYERNALANRVYEYLVSDIDTEVNEEDYRYTQVSYLAITEAEEDADTSDNDEEEADEETEEEEEAVDLEAYAEEVLEQLQEQMEIYNLDSSEDDDSIPYNAVISLYEDNEDISIALTSDTEYSKPEDTSSDDAEDTEDTEEEEETETLQSVCWNNLSTGDYTIWYDEDNATAYVIYCVNDDVEESKEEAIEEELESRRDDMFVEKYATLVEAAPNFKVVSRVYSQVKYEGIVYSTDEDTDADTSGNDVSDND